jgi:hypothetical protein
MMSAKVKTKNDFYFFTQDYKKTLQRENVEWLDMPHLLKLCRDQWHILTAKEKLYYKNQAKEYKNNDVYKYNHMGKSLSSIEKKYTDAAASKMAMEMNINSFVKDTSRNGTLVKEKLFVIHFNILCKVSNLVLL